MEESFTQIKGWEDHQIPLLTLFNCSQSINKNIESQIKFKSKVILTKNTQKKKSQAKQNDATLFPFINRPLAGNSLNENHIQNNKKIHERKYFDSNKKFKPQTNYQGPSQNSKYLQKRSLTQTVDNSRSVSMHKDIQEQGQPKFVYKKSLILNVQNKISNFQLLKLLADQYKCQPIEVKSEKNDLQCIRKQTNLFINQQCKNKNQNIKTSKQNIQTLTTKQNNKKSRTRQNIKTSTIKQNNKTQNYKTQTKKQNYKTQTKKQNEKLKFPLLNLLQNNQNQQNQQKLVSRFQEQSQQSLRKWNLVLKQIGNIQKNIINMKQNKKQLISKLNYINLQNQSKYILPSFLNRIQQKKKKLKKKPLNKQIYLLSDKNNYLANKNKQIYNKNNYLCNKDNQLYNKIYPQQFDDQLIISRQNYQSYDQIK